MTKKPNNGLVAKAGRGQGMVEVRTSLAVVLTKIQNMEGDIVEIKNGIRAINGGLRDNQRDVVAIKAGCRNCADDIDDLKKRMNVFSTLAAVGGGIMGYLGSWFR
jgi:hypothetical protein